MSFPLPGISDGNNSELRPLAYPIRRRTRLGLGAYRWRIDIDEIPRQPVDWGNLRPSVPSFGMFLMWMYPNRHAVNSFSASRVAIVNMGLMLVTACCIYLGVTIKSSRRSTWAFVSMAFWICSGVRLIGMYLVHMPVWQLKSNLTTLAVQDTN